MRVDCDSRTVIGWLREHFRHFAVRAFEGGADLHVTALNHGPPPVPAVGADAGASSLYSTAYRRRGDTFIDFHGRGTWAYGEANRTATAHSRDPETLHEIVHVGISHEVDEQLARRGLHAFRWLGLAQGRAAILLVAPTGTGKTTLALDLLEMRPELALLGDNRVLLSARGDVLPYPVSLALRDGGELPGWPCRRYRALTHEPRLSVGLAPFRDRIAAVCRPAVIALCSRVPCASTSIERVSRTRMAGLLGGPLLARRIAGSGVAGDPGAALGYLSPSSRRGAARARVRTAGGRAHAALRALAESRAYLIRLGSDRAANAEAVAALAHEDA